MAEFLTIKTLADLQSIEANGFEEGLTLEYKASEALCKDKADDMCEDVSAFANSSGGQIIYGIREEDKKPKIDVGVSDPKISKEWIQQILNTRLRPRVQVEIERIEISAGHHAFVVTIPPTKTGPHQHTDRRYYRRYEATQLVMDDQEIRDVMGRATTPDLRVSLSFLNGNRERVDFLTGREESKPFNLIARIENRAAQPAYHVVVTIGVAVEFIIISNGDYSSKPGVMGPRGRPVEELSALPSAALRTFDRVTAGRPGREPLSVPQDRLRDTQLAGYTSEDVLKAVPEVNDDRVHRTFLETLAKSKAQLRKRLGL